MARFEVITGPERRRRWSAEQKRAIVTESLAPGAVVTEIARGRRFAPARSIAGGRRSGSDMASPRC
jgi:transposase